MLFKDQQKLTLISVSEILQTTARREITCTRQVEDRQAYKARGKKQEYFLKPEPGVLIFEGWSLPYSTDTDTKHFISNGCINFITDKPADLRQFIKDKNINQQFNRFDLVMYCKPDTVHPYMELF